MSLYFRHRAGGAQVMRLSEGRDGRLIADPLAVVSLRSGEVRVKGEREMSEAEHAEIERWIARTRDALPAREMDEARRTIEAMNLAAGWIGRADADQVEAVADALLDAALDLRMAVVRRLGDDAQADR